ncbi:DUF6580 family putative transport protein [Bacteroidota bacterium]
MNKNNYTRFAALAGLIFIAALTRLIDHPANISPIMAIAIFGGAYFSDKRLAFILPLLAMALSDLILGFYLISMFVYLSFGLGIFLGFALKNRIKVRNVFFAALSGSVLFFLITNLGSWLTDPMYQPLSIESLIRCYELAIPFFRNTLIGDMAYVTALFGSFALAEKYVPVLQK